MPAFSDVSVDVQALQTKIGYQFKDKNLLVTALTHSSVGGAVSYERLEFLGDRVLGLVVAEILYKKFPEEPEGHLAKRLSALVQGSFLAKIATELDLGAYIIFSESERAAGGADNENILADVFESLVGAMYMDSDFARCFSLIEGLWGDRFDTMVKPPQHPKTRLQEWAQSKGLPLPVYEIIAQEGPDHAPVFDVRVSVQGYEPIVVKGASRQAAEKQAASEFWTLHLLK